MGEKQTFIRARNRPDLRERDKDTLLYDTGQSGWNSEERNNVHKPEGVSEHNFADQHHRFAGPGDDAV